MVLLVEPGLEHPHQRGIEAVQPDHRSIGVVGVVVPGPVGGEDEIAREHREALTVNDRVAAAALDDQAKGRRRMAMGPSNLAWHHDLDVGDQCVAGRHPGQLGVGQAQNSAFGLLGTNELGRPHRLWSQIAPVPQVRHGLAPRLKADAAADPGRRHMLRAELRIVILQLFFGRFDVRKLQHRVLPLICQTCSFTGSFKWVARISRNDSGSLIIAVWAPFRNSSYSRAIAGGATSIISRFSSQNSMTWKNGLWPCMPRPKVLARQPSRAPIRSTCSGSSTTDKNTWKGQVCGGDRFSPNTT